MNHTNNQCRLTRTSARMQELECHRTAKSIHSSWERKSRRASTRKAWNMWCRLYRRLKTQKPKKNSSTSTPIPQSTKTWSWNRRLTRIRSKRLAKSKWNCSRGLNPCVNIKKRQTRTLMLASCATHLSANIRATTLWRSRRNPNRPRALTTLCGNHEKAKRRRKS